MSRWLLRLCLLLAVFPAGRAAESALVRNDPAPAAPPPGVPAATAPAAPAAPAAPLNPPPAGERRRAFVIPVREQVDSPLLYIIRRGLKAASEQKADVVILDMKTPGGALDVTFSIMEALGKFKGRTITFVNDEAISAGAFISATTDEIWFSPEGIIGAAAPVMATGQEIDASMRQKIVSYLKARVRATSEGKGGYRGQVISAMIDADYELKVGDQVLKGKGELLSLTAKEAAATHGDPPQPLLAAGIAPDIEDLLRQQFGAGGYEVTRLEITWSEHFAVFLRSLAPILLGLGLLALYIEFKTPGFGVFGITGIACLAVVFLSNYVAGLSGQEPILVFALGLGMVLTELLFFPGIVVLAVGGLALMLGSLVWSMADIWPNEPVTLSDELFLRPLQDVGLGLALAVVLALLFARFLPRGWFLTRLAVTHPIAGSAQVAGLPPEAGASAAGLVGRVGVAVTGLFPAGQVEVDGGRFEARLDVGSAPPGTRVVVRRCTDFGLVVDALEGPAS